MRILLVDDSRTIRSIQKNTLRGLGYTDVGEADDGLEALAAVASSPPDLILLDWNMPNMDGPTFLRTLRSKGSGIPVIMCTTEGEKSRVLAAIQAGANNYVVKPFTPQVLAEKIEQTMERYAAAAT